MKLTASQPPKGNFVSEEEQAFLDVLASEFVATLENTESFLAAKLDAQLFDEEEHLAFWELLPAKVRTAITRGRERASPPCSGCGQTKGHTRHCTVGGRFA